MFQSAVCAMPCGWWHAKNSLSDCYSPVLLWMPALLATRARQYLLCGLHMLTGCSKTAGECRGRGTLAGLRLQKGSACVSTVLWQSASSLCPLALGWVQENAAATCVHQPQPGGRGALQPPTLSGLSKCHVHCPLLVPARQQTFLIHGTFRVSDLFTAYLC